MELRLRLRIFRLERGFDPVISRSVGQRLTHWATGAPGDNEKLYAMEESVGKPTETDSIKSKTSSKTLRGKKDSTKRHHHKHHQRQPGEQQFPVQVVTG